MPNNIENLAIDNSKDITNLRMNRRGRVQYSVDGGKSYSNLNRDEWLNLLITALTKGCTCEDGSTIVPGENGADGKSAYDIWLELGNTGSEQDFLNSLIGKDGQDGEPGENGKDGSDGKSAYDIWLYLGNTGSEQDFLNSLIGKNGSDGEKGEPGSDGHDGVDGKSAYEIWKELGNEGTKEDFIKSLIGKDGEPGENGQDGIDGLSPTIGNNGNWFIGEDDTGIKANPLTKSAPLEYAYLSLPPSVSTSERMTQEVIEAGTIINFSNIIESNNIETNPENNSVILKAGKTYMMQAVITIWSALSDNKGGYIGYTFYNKTTGREIGRGCTASTDVNKVISSSSPLFCIYTPEQDEEIQVKVVGVTLNDGSTSIQIYDNINPPNTIHYCRWIVQQIGESIILDPLEHVNSETGIEDTPVGHIIAHMGINAPAHYLICDGTEYNISDYPYLAKHITNEFGSVNYFGGDGTTTFAVPDLRGEFLRGTGTGTRKTGSGAAVGQHQDGTEIPNVGFNTQGKGFWIGSSIPEDGNNSIYATQIDKYIQRESNIGYAISNATSWNSSGTAKYTSRPTNTAVLYCIKYEPTYFMKTDAHYMGINQTVLFDGTANEVQLSEDILNYDFIRTYIDLGGSGAIVENDLNVTTYSYIDIPVDDILIKKEYSHVYIRSDAINDTQKLLFVASILIDSSYLLKLTKIGFFNIVDSTYSDRLGMLGYKIKRVVGIKGESEVTE